MSSYDVEHIQMKRRTDSRELHESINSMVQTSNHENDHEISERTYLYKKAFPVLRIFFVRNIFQKYVKFPRRQNKK